MLQKVNYNNATALTNMFCIVGCYIVAKALYFPGYMTADIIPCD